jgi:hypothetical protein
VASVADEDEARAGYETAVAFWYALAQDDDALAAELLYPMARLRNGFTLDGLASQLRERLDVTLEECASMRISNRARLLRDGMWAYIGIPGWRAEIIDKPTLVKASPLGVILDADDRRWVWGVVDQDEWGDPETTLALDLDMGPGARA